MAGVREELLNFYERELTYLRQMGSDFAQKYPKLAGRLLLEPDRCEDPHVERLLEGFALLAARVHLKIDDDFPEISTALIEALYPHYLRPIPSMSIVEFQLDPEQRKQAAGLKIPRGSVLHSNRVGGNSCKFRTAYDATLWPLQISAAKWRSPEGLGARASHAGAVAVLQLTLDCLADVGFKALPIEKLGFYLSGESNIVNALYELLLNNCVAITARDLDAKPGHSPITISSSSLQPVGFEEDEGMLPYSRRSFLGYRLLQEYFTFPEKFFFLELGGLKALAEAKFGSRVEMSFVISRFERPERHQMLELAVNEKTLKLGCTPIVNLFAQTAEPIRVDQTKYEYHVTPDIRRQNIIEVFSIDEVTGQNQRTQDTIAYEPFYAFQHGSGQRTGNTFWHATRRASQIHDDRPADIYLSLVDLSGEAADPETDIITVRCTCTNSTLASKLPIGHENGDFQLEGFSSVQRVVALRRHTPTLQPPLGKSTLWKLISHLSLNHLSLVEEGREALQEILRLYNFSDSAFLRNQINGITALKSRRHLGLITSDGGAAMARGTRIEIELDEEQFAGGGAYLFCSVLERFLGLYASMNSFTQLVATTSQRKEVLREWPRRAGSSILM